MGQDRVRPLALALQGLDYTVGGQTVGGGIEGVWGAKSWWGEYVVAEEGAGGCSGCSRGGGGGGAGGG